VRVILRFLWSWSESLLAWKGRLARGVIDLKGYQTEQARIAIVLPGHATYLLKLSEAPT
jgi:hypothetical protein